MVAIKFWVASVKEGSLAIAARTKLSKQRFLSGNIVFKDLANKFSLSFCWAELGNEKGNGWHRFSDDEGGLWKFIELVLEGMVKSSVIVGHDEAKPLEAEADNDVENEAKSLEVEPESNMLNAADVMLAIGLAAAGSGWLCLPS